MTIMLIARHGNNFDPGQTAVRVGIRTNLPLSASGRQQAINLGNYLKRYKIHPAAVFTSELIRTKETAEIALATAGLNVTPLERTIFNEIDYGPDEGKTYEQIIARIGERALHDWESMALTPPGWHVDVDQIIDNWRQFANEIIAKYPNNQSVLVFTSNGVARFAPYLTHNFFGFSQTHKIKLATGAIGCLEYINDKWEIDYWNEQPK